MTDSDNTIEISVLFFAQAHELAGTARRALVLPVSATVGDAAATLGQEHPRLEPLLEKCRMAVDQEFVDATQKLEDGSELAVIPPVSGG